MSLTPKTDLDIPPFLVWQRNISDIGSIQAPSDFFLQISSSEIRKIGVTNGVAAEQESCLADRLSRVLKIKSDAEATKQLDELTNSEIDVELEEHVGDFWAAFSVCYSCDTTTYDSIQDLVDLLKESLSVCQGSIPSKQNRGNALGSALQTWRRGSAITLKASEYLARAEATAKCIDPFIDLVGKFTNDVSRCSPEILSVEASWANVANAALQCIYDDWKLKLGSCLPEYSVSEDDPRISKCFTQWFTMVLDGWARVFKGILSAEPDTVDQKALVLWIDETSTQRELLSSLTATLAGGPQSLLQPYVTLSRGCEHARSVADTLSLWRTFLRRISEGSIPEMAEYNALQGKTTASFKAFSGLTVGAHFSGSPTKLLESQLVNPEAPHMKAMIEAMVSTGTPKVQPVLEAFCATFGIIMGDKGKLVGWSTKDMSLDNLKLWLNAPLHMPPMNEALQFASSLNDYLLTCQVEFLLAGCQLAKALGEVDLIAKSRAEAQNFKDLLLTEKHVSAWRDVETRSEAFKVHASAMPPPSSDGSSASRYHLTLLDDVISYVGFKMVMEQEFARVRAALSDGIVQDVDTMSETLHMKTPQIPPKKLLGDKLACEQLMDAEHGSMTSIAIHLKDQVKYIKAINLKSVAVGTPALIKKANTASETALTAVALGAILQCTQRDWPAAGFETVKECSVAVSSLKEQVKKTGFTPTEEVAQLLADWQSGRVLQKLQEPKQPLEVDQVKEPQEKKPKIEVEQLTTGTGEKRKHVEGSSTGAASQDQRRRERGKEGEREEEGRGEEGGGGGWGG